MSKILLPGHSEACHSVTIYDGDRYQCEVLSDRKINGDYFDISDYVGYKEARFEHSAATLRGDKQAYEYRSVARIDGIWYPYDPVAPAWGLPVLEVKPCCGEGEACSAEDCTGEPEITGPYPADGKDADGQEDSQSTVEVASESLAPAKIEKKSRTAR